MSRAGDTTALTWSLVVVAVAYSSGLLVVAGPIVALLPLLASLAVMFLLSERLDGCAVGVTALVLLQASFLVLWFLVGLLVMPVVVLLGAAILAPRRRWDRA